MRKAGTKNPTPKRAETKREKEDRVRKNLMAQGRARRKANKKGKY